MMIFFGIALTFLSFLFIQSINKRFSKIKLDLIIFPSLIIVGILYYFNIDFETYNQGGHYLSMLIQPATVALAIPLYKNKKIIKKYAYTIMGSILMGTLIHALSIWILSILLKLDRQMIVTIIPKSVTSAIAKDLSVNFGGIQEITVALVIVTGIFGSMISPFLFKVFKVKEKGLVLGVGAHAVGTSTAIKMNEKEATMATLGLILTGLLTVILMPLFVLLFT